MRLFPTEEKAQNKHESEVEFWRNKFDEDKQFFRNDWYKKTMLAMATEQNDDFIKDKILADFGCGPRGTLEWAKSAKIKIGIDVLADLYVDEFKDCLLKHGMIYLKSTENAIPLPSNFIDVMFSLNAIDHVDNFEEMCAEILRVLKPKGLLIASFNLNEPVSITEPQSLTESKVKESILDKMEIQNYRLSHRGSSEPYQPFFEGKENYADGEPAFLWVRASKIE